MLCATLVSSDSVPHSLLSFPEWTSLRGGSWASAIQGKAQALAPELGIVRGGVTLPGVDEEGGTDLVLPRCEAPWGRQAAQPAFSQSESESHSVMSHSLQPRRLYSPWDSPGQNTRVGSLSLLQGIFPTQRLSRCNSGLLKVRLSAACGFCIIWPQVPGERSLSTLPTIPIACLMLL